MRQLPLVVLTQAFHPEVIDQDLRPRARVRIIRHLRELPAALRHADGLITRFSEPVPEALLAQAPRLKVVGNYAVGYNNIDVEACTRRRIIVVNTPRVLTRATAELALALLLAAARRIPEGESLCRKGRFKGWASDLLLGLELRGRQAVLVGQGRIGRETARLFRGIGLKVDWITRQDSAASIQAKLSQAQVLSLHFSLNPSTSHWLDERKLGFLPRDAIVINTTRGPAIDEKALIRALQRRRIFAAGLDVYEREPDIPAALRKLPNVVLLPHLGSATRETREAMARLVISGVLGVLGGKHPWNAVNQI